MKQFTKGFVLGSLATVAAVASGVMTFHQTVIKPIEETEEKFENNQKAATRKNRSAHQML